MLMAMYKESTCIAAGESIRDVTVTAAGSGNMKKQDFTNVMATWKKQMKGGTGKGGTKLTGPRPDMGIDGGRLSPGKKPKGKKNSG